jgi:hypothetical protein
MAKKGNDDYSVGYGKPPVHTSKRASPAIRKVVKRAVKIFLS